MKMIVSSKWYQLDRILSAYRDRILSGCTAQSRLNVPEFLSNSKIPGSILDDLLKHNVSYNVLNTLIGTKGTKKSKILF